MYRKYFFPLANIVGSSLIIGLFYFLASLGYQQSSRQVAMKNAKNAVAAKIKPLLKTIQRSKNSLRAVRKSHAFQSYLQGGPPDALSELLGAMAASQSEVMQFRYLDPHGMERVRWERREEGGRAFEVTEKELQNKFKRDYFQESLHRGEEVWFSDLDLNVEHGEIEIPYRPAYRAILPVIDKGNFQGILVVNLFAGGFLNELMRPGMYDVILMDEEGYVILDSKEDVMWGRYRFPPQRPVVKKVGRGGDLFVERLDLPFRTPIYMHLDFRRQYMTEEESIHLGRLQVVAWSLFFLACILSISLYFFFSRIQTEMADKDLRIEASEVQIMEKERILFQQSKLAQIGEMIGAIAHQWRHPLHILNGVFFNLHDLAEMKHPDHSSFTGHISTGKDQIQFMMQTIEDFRDFFRPENRFTPISVTKCFEESLRLLHQGIAGQAVQVRVHSQEEIRILGSKNLMKHAFLILLLNARDAIVWRGVSNGLIVLRVGRNGPSDVVVEMEDNGGGIKEGKLGMLFTPYATAKEGRKGTGLGLYMCKKIVESFSGVISVRNGEKGAIVTMNFPAL